MKTIGIIGAMEEEIALLKNNTEIVSAKNIVGTDFFMGKMFGKSVVIVRSGIGKVNAAICTQVLINMYGVDYIINTGVAGALNKELKLGDIVISNDLLQHDFDTSATGDPLGVIPRLHESTFKADEELVRIAELSARELVKADEKVVVGRIATGDQFISDSNSKERIWNNFKPYCVEMEGAAIAQACYLNKIPFVSIRSISDSADEDAPSNFKDHVNKVANNSCYLVENIIKEL